MSPADPGEPAVGFPTPPVRFRDTEGRSIVIRAFDSDDPGGADGANGGAGGPAGGRTGPIEDDAPERAGDGPGDAAVPTAREALVEMYDAFDPADRAQGIPPSGRGRIRDWLGTVLAPDCYNVIAWDGGRDPERAVGHATLVPDDDAYELAIFVLQRYQEAGIGTRLLRALLGHGRAGGVGRVWLSVERWNRAAIGLYRKIGFETVEEGGFEQVMRLRLAAGDDGGRGDEARPESETGTGSGSGSGSGNGNENE